MVQIIELLSTRRFFTTGLYWCDSRLETIERMDYDAKNRVILLDSNKSGLENPQGIGFYQQQLFWIDETADGGTLNRVSTENTSDYNAISNLQISWESLKDVKV